MRVLTKEIEEAKFSDKSRISINVVVASEIVEALFSGNLGEILELDSGPGLDRWNEITSPPD